MQVNSIQNTSFGQIFVSPEMKERIKKQFAKMPEDRRPDWQVFKNNWKRCQNTKEFDLLITNDAKVYMLDKNGQRVLEEKILSRFIWNIDTALKRILLFEDANPFQQASKYDH
ncbi:MAG: hypothetical protein K6A44_06085 [bacterium]|nr:hypothetical protein [bacterium]